MGVKDKILRRYSMKLNIIYFFNFTIKLFKILILFVINTKLIIFILVVKNIDIRLMSF